MPAGTSIVVPSGQLMVLAVVDIIAGTISGRLEVTVSIYSPASLTSYTEILAFDQPHVSAFKVSLVVKGSPFPTMNVFFTVTLPLRFFVKSSPL